MILIVGTLRIPDGAIDIVRPMMEMMVLASRQETGCISYSYSLDVLDAGLIWVNEAWNDRAALAAHFATEHLAQWRANFAALGITDRNLRLYETDEGERV